MWTCQSIQNDPSKRQPEGLQSKIAPCMCTRNAVHEMHESTAPINMRTCQAAACVAPCQLTHAQSHKGSQWACRVLQPDSATHIWPQKAAHSCRTPPSLVAGGQAMCPSSREVGKKPYDIYTRRCLWWFVSYTCSAQHTVCGLPSGASARRCMAQGSSWRLLTPGAGGAAAWLTGSGGAACSHPSELRRASQAASSEAAAISQH